MESVVLIHSQFLIVKLIFLSISFCTARLRLRLQVCPRYPFQVLALLRRSVGFPLLSGVFRNGMVLRRWFYPSSHPCASDKHIGLHLQITYILALWGKHIGLTLQITILQLPKSSHKFIQN